MTVDSQSATTSLPDPAWYRGPYFVLTVMLVLSVILYPLATGVFGPYVQKIVYSALLLSGLYAVAHRRSLFRILGAVVLPVIGCETVA